MSAFSRGLTGFLHQHSLRLPSSIRFALFSAPIKPSQSSAGARVSSAFFIRQYVRPTNRLQAIAAPSYRSFMGTDPTIRAVQASRKPVLLYQAPDRRLYMIGVYGLAGGLIGAALWTLRWSNELPKDLPPFVKPTYIVVAMIMFAIGNYIFTAPVRRCTSIELIPNILGGSGVQLRIKARTVPFLKDRVIVANVGEVTIREKTLPVTQELIEAERARRQRVSEGLEGVFITRRAWEITLRLIEQKWMSFFLRFKFAVLRFGIVKMNVQGDTWKIDCEGYMREDGKAIDRLIAVD